MYLHFKFVKIHTSAFEILRSQDFLQKNKLLSKQTI